MFMSVDELNQGLGDLGRFSLKRAVQRLNPVAVAKSQIANTQKALKMAVQMAKPAEVIKSLRRTADVVKKLHDPREHIKFAQARHAQHMEWIRKIEKNKIAGPIFNAVVIVVATYFGVGEVVAPLMKLWLASEKQRSAAIAAGEQQQHSAAEAAQAEADLRREILANGYSDAEASQIIDQINAGVDPRAAIQSIGLPHQKPLASGPLASVAVTQAQAVTRAQAMIESSAPAVSSHPSLETAMQTKQAEAHAHFVDWFRQFRPEAAAALEAARPELFAPLAPPQALSGFDDGVGDWTGEDHLGQTDWGDMFSSAMESISTALPEVLNKVVDYKTAQLQLQRAKQGQPLLPTATAQKLAVSGKAPGLALSMPLVVGGVLVVGLAVVLLAPGLFGRRHHSRFL